MPDILVALAQRMVRWGVLPRAKAPDSAIINIYDVVSEPLPTLAHILCLPCTAASATPPTDPACCRHAPHYHACPSRCSQEPSWQFLAGSQMGVVLFSQLSLARMHAGAPAQEDCIPPHVDNHDFSRPFCTLSLLSEQPILFGQRLRPLDPANRPGEFTGSDFSIPLPPGALLDPPTPVLTGLLHCPPFTPFCSALAVPGLLLLSSRACRIVCCVLSAVLFQLRHWRFPGPHRHGRCGALGMQRRSLHGGARVWA